MLALLTICNEHMILSCNVWVPHAFFCFVSYVCVLRWCCSTCLVGNRVQFAKWHCASPPPSPPPLLFFFFLSHPLNVFLGYVILCVVALLIGKCIQAACILHRASPPTPLIFLLRLVNVFSVYMFFCKCCLHLPHTLCKVLFPLFCF